MNAITYTQARKNFTQTMNRVCEESYARKLCMRHQAAILSVLVG